jgi:hypothetical protein
VLETLGVVDRSAGSGSEAWWLHLLPDQLHVPATIVMAVLGGLLVLCVLAEERRRKAERRKRAV